MTHNPASQHAQAGVFLDLELQESGLRVGAMVSGGQPWRFGPELLSQVNLVVQNVPLLIGHNIRRFDLPELEKLTSTTFPAVLDTRVVDTLELASLFFPGEPSQALDKLYREHTVQSDPVEDCQETAELYERCLNALPDLPHLVRHLAGHLLPDGATKELLRHPTTDPHRCWEELAQLSLDGDWHALRQFVEHLPPAAWSNFGVLVSRVSRAQ